MTDTGRVTPLARLRRGWRWGALAILVAVLVGLPSLAAARPASTAAPSPAELLARVRSSADVGWSGYGESRGALVVPDVRELGDLPSLVGGTTRLRAWWRGPDSWRVDALALAGETDVITDPAGSWTWDSADRTATRLNGQLPVRLPQAPDLLAPPLGRRLAGAPDVTPSALPARRVAGRSASGLRLTPTDPAGTTVASVDLWVEPDTGLPLEVQVRADGQDAPSLTSLLLDLDLTRPSIASTTFTPPPQATVSTGRAPDLAARIDGFAPFLLPDTLAGAPRTDAVDAFRTVRGVATYGRGFATYVVIPLPRDVGRTVLTKLAQYDGRIQTPLVSGLVARADRRTYLLAGTVPAAVLDRALAELAADPPPFRGDR